MPGSVTVKPGQVYYDSRFGALSERMEIRLGKKVIQTAGVPILEQTQKNHELSVSIYAQWIFDQLELQRKTLHPSLSRQTKPVPLGYLVEQLEDLLEGAVSLHELERSERILIGKLSRLETYIGDSAHARRHLGQRGKKHGKKRQIWKPPHLRRGRKY